MTNTKITIKNKMRHIRALITDLKANDPHRTTEQAKGIAKTAITMCYVVLDFAEAAQLDNIITAEEYKEIAERIRTNFTELTKLNNEL